MSAGVHQLRRAVLRSRRHRRGGIYVVMLTMSMLVSVIAMGGLMAARVQCRTANAACDFATARLCARAGIELAMYRMRSDPSWRNDLGNGAWYSNVPLGGGAFSVSAADPISGNVTLAANHPVVLTSTGTANAANYQMQVQVQVDPQDDSCVEVSACSGGNFATQSCILNSTQTVTSNGNFTPDPKSTINAKVEYGGTLGPGTYSSSQTLISPGRTLPDPVGVFSYYNTNGTAIPYTSLLQSNTTNVVPNGSFETNVAGWYVYSPSGSGATITRDTTQHKDGQAALLISGRGSTGDVPATDLPLVSVRKGDTYQLQVPVYAISAGTVQAELVLVSDSGTQTFTTPAVTFPPKGGWSTAQANIVPTWTGVLQKATLTLICTDSTCSLDVDAVSMTDTTFAGGNNYVMDRMVLSPTQNPYGSPNPLGIYLINCNNQAVTIGPCRIVGTLVLTNVGPQVTIQGPITWETPIAGYPALMVDKNCTISFDSSVALSESTYGVNFNPSGTPYPFPGGTSNATATDSSPSGINGIVYCGGNLTVATAPQITGCLICAGNITAQATSLNLTYNNASFINPPPGFGTGLQSLTPQPWTWRRNTH